MVRRWQEVMEHENRIVNRRDKIELMQLDKTDQAFFVQAINRFLPVSESDWDLLLPHLQYRMLQKGECWIREGRTETSIGLVLEGNLRQYYTKDDEEKTTYFFFEPHLLSSYISCIKQQPSQLTIEALTDCRLVAFSYERLRGLFSQSHTWERFGRLIAEYAFMGLEERMISLLTLSPEERYLQLLESNKHKILERIPQHYIANYLGITPVSLSRIRNRLLQK